MTALIVCSKSTLKYAKEMGDKVYQVTHPPDRETLDIIVPADEIIAIGGGSVIDMAKIMGAQSGINTILAYPTTASGASETSHAVYWDAGRKHTIKTPKPITLFNIKFVKGLSISVLRNSNCDALSHAWESLVSNNRTVISDQLAKAALAEPNEIIRGILAGQAIEITGTNVAHALSYPLTGHYEIPHSVAVKIMLPKFKIVAPDKDYDYDLLVSEALSYPQIHETDFEATRESVRGLYKEALCR